MKLKNLTGLCLAAIMLMAGCAGAMAQHGKARNIKLHGETFVISYDDEGDLASVGCEKSGNKASEYRFTYPGGNLLSYVFGIYIGDFKPSTTTVATFYPSQNKFTEMWQLEDSESSLFYTVTEAGVVCDGDFETTLKWGKDGVSEIEYYGDTQSFSYFGFNYSPSGDFDWLAFAINEVVSDTGFLKYWYTGELLRPFKKYPSEIIEIVNGKKTVYKFEYDFSQDNITVSVKKTADGQPTRSETITVLFG